MRLLDSEGKESFNIPVPLQLFPPYEWDDKSDDKSDGESDDDGGNEFLENNLRNRLLLIGDRSFTSIKVTPLES
jgi:hypothetical protein